VNHHHQVHQARDQDLNKKKHFNIMFKTPSSIPTKRARESNVDKANKRVRIESSEPPQQSIEQERIALRKSIKELQKYTEMNIQKRLKFPDDPQQWLESEIKIDMCLKQLQNLSTDAKLYNTFVEAGGVTSIVTLLSHENSDVVLDVIDLLIELTEIDGESSEDITSLMDSIFENEVIQTLIDMLIREDSNDLSRQSKSLILQIVENLHRYDPEQTSQYSILLEKTKLCEWMFNELSTSENMDELHSYVCELLAIFAATPIDSSSAIQKTIGKHCEKLLVKINYFRKHKPKNMEEEEILHNIFDCLCSCLMNEEIQTLFNELEGIDLMLILTRDVKAMRHPAIKTISYALSNNQKNCVTFMDSKGHKTLFAVLMKLSSLTDEQKSVSEEHIISIIVSLITYIHEKDEKVIVSKFTEKNFEKLNSIMELFIKYYTKVYLFDQRVESGTWERSLGNLQLDEEEKEELIFKERLSEGLFVLQRICIILGFLYSNNTEFKKFIQSKLDQVQIPLLTIVAILQDYEEAIQEDATTTTTTADSELQEKYMVQHFIARMK
jgi:beta-catenin-like protein 1